MKTGAVLLATATLALAACSGEKEAEDIREAVASASPDGAAGEPSPTPTDPAVAYDGPIPQPIMIGSDGPEMDACGTLGEVANLDPAGDNYLSVRDAPSTLTKERDRLDPGQRVTVCDSADGWVGIIYSKIDENCGVSSPVATEERYLGPCAQGWVDERFVEMIAG